MTDYLSAREDSVVLIWDVELVRDWLFLYMMAIDMDIYYSYTGECDKLSWNVG